MSSYAFLYEQDRNVRKKKKEKEKEKKFYAWLLPFFYAIYTRFQYYTTLFVSDIIHPSSNDFL